MILKTKKIKCNRSFRENFATKNTDNNVTKLNYYTLSHALIACYQRLAQRTTYIDVRLLAIFHFNEICHFDKPLHTIHIYSGLNLGTC